MKRKLVPLITTISAIAILQTAPPVNANKSISITDPLDKIQTKGGKTLCLDVGIGSGACRSPHIRDNIIFTITDRGPVIKISDSDKLLGKRFDNTKGKIFLTPNFAPTIYKLKIHSDHVEILEKIQLKNSAGISISGISNPQTEAAWNVSGREIEYDPAGVDAEGIAALKDSTFWIGEEYGPSILHVASDGKVLERWVPEGIQSNLVGSGYPVKEKLPAILRKRPLNRGIESMTVSPDEQFLYFAMQSPLANPNKKAYNNSRNVRIFKIDRKQSEIVGEFVYRLDTSDSFQSDNRKKKRKQHDVKISELTAVDTDRLVVLEHISATTKFYLVDLSQGNNIYASKWDSVETTPTLEQTEDIDTLKKKLLLDTDTLGGLMKKIEGVAWMGGDNWIMINDNDFGISGDITTIVPVVMPLK